MDEAKNEISDLEHKEEKNTQSEQKEEKRIQKNPKKPTKTKNENRLRSLWDNFKCTNIQIIEVPEGEEKKQEIENLFEKIMKENFLNLVKEIDIQVQESQSPKQDGRKVEHTRYIIIKMPKVKDKERILKAAREKQRVT